MVKTSVFKVTLICNLFEFESVPGTNQYLAMRVKFLAEGNKRVA